MSSSSSTPEKPQDNEKNTSTVSDSDAAGQADAGDTSFVGEGNTLNRQPAQRKEAEVNIPQAPETSGQTPQKGTGLDSPDAGADQADAGDTSMDPGKDTNS